MIGSWSVNTVWRPACVATRTVPPTPFTMLCTTSRPDAAAGDLRHLVLRGEAREEEELEQLQLGELVGHLTGDEAPRHEP